MIGLPLAIALPGLAALFVLCAAFPLAMYAVPLATFGLAHVASELRYVDRRFGARVDRSALVVIVGLLACIVALRTGYLTRVLPRAWYAPAEVALLAGLSFVPLPSLWRAGRMPGVASLVVTLAFVVATLVSPLVALLALAVLHNLTPLGFVAEITPAARRGPVMAGAVLAFVGLPLLLASGMPSAALARAGLWFPDTAVMPTTPLASHLGLFFPPSWHASSTIAAAFGAVAMAQSLHYWATIVWMPRLLPDDARGVVPWPRTATFILAVAGASAVLFSFYVLDFAAARAFYSVIASVHAWIEIPALLLALSSTARLRFA